MMLEDDFTDVLRKAMQGHGLSPAQAAARAGLTVAEVHGLLDGSFTAATAQQLARMLGLHPRALANHPDYHPRLLAHPSITRLDLPFGSQGVNAWLIHRGGHVLLFDTGYQADDLLDAMRMNHHDMPGQVFLTHGHRDHVGALEALMAAGVQVNAAGIPGTTPMAPGQCRVFPPLTIRACDLSGHAIPALGYHLEGLEQRVLVTGDALFAGSIGGCGSPANYQQALTHLHAVLDPLPDSTILLPGHGPATTLGEERQSNPFLYHLD